MIAIQLQKKLLLQKTLLYQGLRFFTCLFVFLLLSRPLFAAQIDDVSLPDSIKLDGTDTGLQLNGMGYRTKFIFNIYVAGLCTEKKAGSRDEVQALTGPKRVVMHMVYSEVEREKMANGWREGFEENTSDEQYTRLKPRLDTFISYFPDMKEGDEVYLDYIPGVGTRVTINNEVKGVIEGADFYPALLDVWLGEEPADEDLKEAMLGEDED